jgi:MFS family permease
MASDRDSLWRNRDFMLLWSGQVVSTIGSSASEVIYPLLILALTQSPAAAGFSAAIRFVPYLVFSLPAGALVDRWDRKRVMIACDIGRALAVISIPVAILFDALTLAQIYLVAFLEGTLFVFFNIAEVAALPRVVETRKLPEATAQNQAAFGVAGIAGPSIGTFLYQSLSRAAPFVFNALSYTVSAISLAYIHTSFRARSTAPRRHLVHEILEGLHWLWEQRVVRHMALLTGGLNMINASVPLILIVRAKEMGADATSIGLIFSIGAVGAVIGAMIGGRIQRRFDFGPIIITIVWLQTLLFPLYAVAPRFWMLGIISSAIYFMSPVYNVVQFSYRVSLIPDALQGRVNSTFRLVAFGFMPVGAALTGLLVEHFGTTWAVAVLAGIYVVFAVATTLNPSVRNAARIDGSKAVGP